MATKKVWAARDMKGNLFLFSKRPPKLSSNWVSLSYAQNIVLDQPLLDNVKWADLKSTKVIWQQ